MLQTAKYYTGCTQHIYLTTYLAKQLIALIFFPFLRGVTAYFPVHELA